MTSPTGDRPTRAGPAGPGRQRPWLVLTAVCLGFFMILLDTTIVNIAIPDMSAALDASLDQILWVINAYILVYAVLLITAGRLGDLYGPKPLFITGLVIFTLASAACGLAGNPGQLIAARIAQGVGGALLTPQTLSVLTVIFPAERRGAAFGIWGAVGGVATVAGPTLGGYLVTDWGWEWIFFVNVPIGVATIVLAALVMPDFKLDRRHKLDWTGTLLATVGLFLITYGLIEGEPHGWGQVWGPVTIPEVIVAGVAVLAIFMYLQYATRHREPLVPFAIFADRNYALMSWVSAAIAFGMLGLFLPLVIFLQSVLGLSALQAGITLAPISLISMFIAPVAGRLADRSGGKWILVAGLSLWSTGMGMVVRLADASAGQWHILPGLVVAGVGLGLTFAPLQTLAMRNIPPHLAGAAAGFITTTRQLGAVIGSASVGALLQVQLASQLTRHARLNATGLPAEYRDGFVAGFQRAAGGDLQVGAGQPVADLPPGLTGPAREAVSDAVAATFHQGFTDAMQATLVLPLVVLAVAALSCLLIKPQQPPHGHGGEGPAAGPGRGASRVLLTRCRAAGRDPGVARPGA